MAKLIDDVRGGTKAAAIAGVRSATLYEWKKAGRIRLLAPALRLARP